MVQLSKESEPIFVTFGVDNAECQGKELALRVGSGCSEQNPFVLRFEMSAVDSEEGLAISEPFRGRVKT